MSSLTSPSGHALLDELSFQVSAGAAPHDLRGLPDRVVRAITLAASTGAGVEPALSAARAALDDAREIERSTTAATAQARAVTHALAALPVVSLTGIGSLLDQPLWGFYATGAGRATAAVGATLLALGIVTARAVTTRALRTADAGDELLDLVATALTAGLSPGAALREVAAVLPTRADDLHRAALVLELDPDGEPPGALVDLIGVIRAARRWGAPTAPALRRLAADVRADERARVLAATQRLPALLTFPTVLFLLPASLLLTGAPVLAHGLGAAAAGT